MSVIIHDPTCQFVLNIVLGFFALVVSVFAILNGRRWKGFTYEILFCNPLLSAAVDRVQILIDGKTVNDVFFIVIQFRNSGNLPILASDFESKITLNFNHNTMVYLVEVIETKPAGIKATVNHTLNTVTLEPLLFNPEDSVTLGILVDQFTGRLHVEGRIIGVKEIREYRPKPIIPEKVMSFLGFEEEPRDHERA
jgi:hypothetical protein